MHIATIWPIDVMVDGEQTYGDGPQLGRPRADDSNAFAYTLLSVAYM